MVIINSCVALIMLYIIFHVFNSHFPYVPLNFNMNFTFITFDIKKMKIVHENYCQWHEIYTCNTTYIQIFPYHVLEEGFKLSTLYI